MMSCLGYGPALSEVALRIEPSQLKSVPVTARQDRDQRKCGRANIGTHKVADANDYSAMILAR
jgi:hypothetical protein